MNIELRALLQQGDGAGLKERLKRSYIPLLFQNCVAEKNSFSGIAADKFRCITGIDEAEGRWQAIFDEALAGLDRGSLSCEEGYELYRFEQSFRKGSEILALKPDFPLKEIQVVEQEDLSDSLLALPDEGFFDLNLARSLLGANFPAKELKLADLIPLITPFFGDKRVEEVFQKALKWELEMQELIARGKDEEKRAEAREGIRRHAGEVASALSSLKAGESLMLFGNTGGMEPSLRLPLSSSWLYLLTGENLKGSASTLYKSLAPDLRGVMDIPLLTSILGATRIKDRFAGGREFSWNEALSSPAQFVKNEAKLVARDFCEDMEERLLNALESGLSKELASKLMEAVRKNKDLMEVVEGEAIKFVEEKLRMLRRQVGSLMKGVSQEIPSALTTLMTLLGFGELGCEEQPYLVELTKQESGLFSVSVYISGGAVISNRTFDGKMHSAFIYQNVPREKINQDFFYSLFRYRFEPAWDDEVFYQFQNVVKGTLASLGSVSSIPQSISLLAHDTPGYWGILNECLAKWRSVENGDARDRLQFNMRLKALVTVWRASKRDPSLIVGGKVLLAEGAALHKKGIISANDLQSISATVKEVMGAFSDIPEERELPQIFPKAMVGLARSVLSSVEGNYELIRDFCLDSLGEGAKDSVDELIHILRKEGSVSLTVLDTAAKAPQAPVSKPPRLWQRRLEALSTAWRVVRIALFVLFSPKVAAMMVVTDLALRYFGPSFLAPLNAAFSVWNRLKNRLFVKALFTFAFSKEQKGEWNALVDQMKAHIIRNGKISYELTSKRTPLEEIGYTRHIGKGSAESDLMNVRSESDLFLKAHPKLTEENAASEIALMVKESASFTQGVSLVYLNLAMKAVPVPKKGKEEDLWMRLEDVNGCLESLGKLAIAFHDVSYNPISNEQESQTIVNLYTLYAIMEKLSKRTSESRLGDYTINPWNLVLWAQQPRCRVLDGEVQNRLKELYAYFGLGDPATTHYTQSDIGNASGKFLFFSNANGKNNWFDRRGLRENQHSGTRELTMEVSPLTDNKYEFEYYNRLLADKVISDRLEKEFGLPPSAPIQERLAVLMSNPPADGIAEGSKFSELLALWKGCDDSEEAKRVEEALLRVNELAASTNSQSERYTGILPFSFHLLRLTHYICKQRILYFTRTQALNDLGRLTIYSSPFSITERGHALRDFIKVITRNRLCKGNIDKFSELRNYTGAYTVISGTGLSYTHEEEFHVSFVENGFRDFSFSRHGEDKKVSLTLFNRCLTHPTRNRQQDIINCQDPLSGRAPSWWGRIKQYMKKDVVNINYDVPLHRVKLLEMTLVDEKDRPVRVLAFFQDNMHVLALPFYRAFLELFLFHRNLLLQQIKTHPEFLDRVFLFFTEAVETLVSDDKLEAAEDLLRMGIYIHLQAETHALNVSKPLELKRLTALIEKGIKKSKEKSYTSYRHQFVFLYYSMKDPVLISLEEREEIIGELLIADALEANEDGNDTTKREVWARWKPWIKLTLDNNTGIRNRVMNRLIQLKGFKAEEGWEGSFPIYRLGSLQINVALREGRQVFQEKVCNFDSNKDKQKVIDELQKAFPNLILWLRHISFNNGECFIEKENITVKIEASSHTFTFFKWHGGRNYQWIDGSRGDDLPGTTYWLSQGVDPRMIKMVNGVVQSYYKVAVQEGKITLLSEGKDLDGRWLERVPLTGTLSLLSWFQKPETIKCYADPASPSRVARIELTESELQFEVREQGRKLRAYSEGEFAGFSIAEQQRIPSLTGYSKYLLLEKANQKIVLISTEGITGGLVRGFLDRLGVSLHSEFMNAFLDGYWKTRTVIEDLPPYYAYNLDAIGRPSSRNPSAILFLLSYHLSLSHLEEVLFYLDLLEGMAKGSKLPSYVPLLVLGANGVAFATQDPLWLQIGLRLSAMNMENFAMRGGAIEIEMAQPLKIFEFAITQINYCRYLKARGRLQLKLDPFQELFLILNLKRLLMYPLDYLLGIDSIKKGIGWSEHLNQFSDLLMHPDIMKREEILLRENLPKELGDTPVWRKLWRALYRSPTSLLLDQAYNLANAGTFFQEGVDFMVRGSVLFNPETRVWLLQSADFNTIPLENLPTRELTYDLIAKHFFSYYTLLDKCDPHHPKVEEFKKALSFLNGTVLGTRAYPFAILEGIVRKHMKSVDSDLLKSEIINYRTIVESLRRRKEEEAPQKNTSVITPSGKKEIDLIDWLIKKSHIQHELRVQRERLSRGNGDRDIAALEELNKALQDFDQVAAKRKGLVVCSDEENRGEIRPSTPLLRQLFDISLVKFSADKALEMDQEQIKKMAVAYAKTRAASYLLSKIGFGKYLPYVYQMGNYALQGVDIAQTLHGIFTKQALRPRLSNEPLASELADALAQEDFIVENHLSDLLKSAISPGERKKVNTSLRLPYPKDDLLTASSIAMVNRSLIDYENRPDSEKWANPQLSSVQALNELRCRLECNVDQLNNSITDEKVRIVDLVNASRRKAHESNIDFQALLHLFLKGEVSEEVTLSLYRCLVWATRAQQMERAIGHCKKWYALSPAEREGIDGKIALRNLAEEMSAKRAYTFDKIPSRLLRGYLCFEYKTSKMLWSKQVSQLEKMLLNDGRKQVIELIMGSGKTFFGIPTTDYFGADGHQLVVNIWPANMLNTNLIQINEQSSSIFGQDTYAMSFSRSDKLSLEQMKGRYLALARIIVELGHLNMCKEDAQALELVWIEGVHRLSQGNEGAAGYNARDLQAQSLKVLKARAKASIDETHETLRRDRQLNHPHGQKKYVKTELSRACQEFVRALVSPEVSELINIRSNTQEADCKANWGKARILLAKKLSRLPLFGVKAEDREEFIDYLLEKGDRVPDFVLNSPQRSAIGLARGLLGPLGEKSLLKIANVHYGPSKANKGRYARPYRGNGNPVEEATIRNPYEATLKTYVQQIVNRLKPDEVKELITMMHARAETEKVRQRLPIDMTPTGALFKTWCPNHSLEDAIDADWEALAPLINRQDEAILLHAHSFIIPDISYYPANYSSNSQNFASMFHSYYSDTGTPSNHETYPQDTQVHWDKGTLGETVSLLHTLCGDPSAITIIEEEEGLDEITWEQVLALLSGLLSDEEIQKIQENGCDLECAPLSKLEPAILDRLRKILSKEDGEELAQKRALRSFLKKVFIKEGQERALIDCGAHLRGMDNGLVAKGMLDFAKKHMPGIKGVVFFKDNQDLSILDSSGKVLPFLDNPYSPSERLSLFDHSHTFAADIPQDSQAVGVVTIGEDVTLTSLAQAVWRMRGLKREQQKLRLLIDKKTLSLITNEASCTIGQIIQFAAKNEAHAQHEDNFYSEAQKITNVVRRAVIDKLLAESQEEKIIEIFKAFTSLLISHLEDDPFILYGQIRKESDPKDVIKELKREHLALVKESGLFSHDDLANIRSEFAKIGFGRHYPASVKTTVFEGRIVLSDGDINQEVEVHMDQNESEAVSVQQTQAVEEVEKNQTTQLNVMDDPTDDLLPSKPWRVRDYFTSFSWLQLSKISAPLTSEIHFYSLDEVVAASPIPQLAELKRAFEGDVWCTSNFVGICQKVGEERLSNPFGKRPVPIQEVLVIHKGENNYSIGLLDQHEASFWREQLEKNKVPSSIALFDIPNNSVVCSTVGGLCNADLDNNQLFQRNIARLKFLKGNVIYTPIQLRRLEKWISLNQPKKLKVAFKILNREFGTGSYSRSAIESIFEKLEDDLE